ncbi:uncharacterized protein LOC133381346 [Rhineura floridana]|uniref:uncharacterized protein LOC133381346 n=1 Tax=Rhineura floridana TaxID=261503 RepID=UPI002AC810D0|nr:uncharacterized protein LOC133381346 [Rhineura floridana]XP_061476338.1 uncharacterized protein LOC133381346 [Rhineura floridana]
MEDKKPTASLLQKWSRGPPDAIQVASEGTAVSLLTAGQTLCDLEKRPLSSAVKREEGNRKSYLHSIQLELNEAVKLLPEPTSVSSPFRPSGSSKNLQPEDADESILSGGGQKPPREAAIRLKEAKPYETSELGKSGLPSWMSAWDTAGVCSQTGGPCSGSAPFGPRPLWVRRDPGVDLGGDASQDICVTCLTRQSREKENWNGNWRRREVGPGTNWGDGYFVGTTDTRTPDCPFLFPVEEFVQRPSLRNRGCKFSLSTPKSAIGRGSSSTLCPMWEEAHPVCAVQEEPLDLLRARSLGQITGVAQELSRCRSRGHTAEGASDLSQGQVAEVALDLSRHTFRGQTAEGASDVSRGQAADVALDLSRHRSQGQAAEVALDLSRHRSRGQAAEVALDLSRHRSRGQAAEVALDLSRHRSQGQTAAGASDLSRGQAAEGALDLSQHRSQCQAAEGALDLSRGQRAEGALDLIVEVTLELIPEPDSLRR